MPVAFLVIRCLLSLVFLVAAAAKLADRPGTVEAVRDFGVPGALTPSVSVILPILEIVAAALLIPGVTAFFGAILALLLLLAFSTAVVRSLARGETPDCHCFGQVYSEPIGWPTLARNGVLGVAAIFLLASGPPNHDPAAFRSLSALSPIQGLGMVAAVVILALLATLLVLVLRLSRQSEQLLIRLKLVEALARGVSDPSDLGLPVGSPAPDFTLTNLSGDALELSSLVSDSKALLLLFASPSCKKCEPLLAEAVRWEQEYAKHLAIAVVSSGTIDSNRDKVEPYGLHHVLVQYEHEVDAAYQVRGTPSAVLIHPDGTIASPLAEGADQVQLLLRRFLDLLLPPPIDLADRLDRPAQPPESEQHLAEGDRIPSVQLPSMDGQTIDLSDLSGERTVIVSYSTGCGWCLKFLPDLLAWDSARPTGAPRLAVIATGPEGLIREQLGSMTSLVMLEPEYSTADLLDLPGTPMAAVFDDAGRLVTRAAGAAAILEVLNDAKLEASEIRA